MDRLFIFCVTTDVHNFFVKLLHLFFSSRLHALYTVEAQNIHNVHNNILNIIHITDDLVKVTGKSWMRKAQERNEWRTLKVTYNQHIRWIELENKNHIVCNRESSQKMSKTDIEKFRPW